MLSAVIVRKDTKMPGYAFFECAQRLGLLDSDDPDDRKAFWEAELARVRGHELG